MRADDEAALRAVREDLRTVTNRIHAIRLDVDRRAGYRTRAARHIQTALGACDHAIRSLGHALGDPSAGPPAQYPVPRTTGVARP